VVPLLSDHHVQVLQHTGENLRLDDHCGGRRSCWSRASSGVRRPTRRLCGLHCRREWLVAACLFGYPASARFKRYLYAIAGLAPPVATARSMLSAEQQPDFAKGDGLVPVIVQQTGTGVVLMLAYMNRAAYEETLAGGRAVYYSRSRGGLWRKGETSGNVQHVKRISLDCDRDTLLLEVEQVGGAACHQGYKSCFFREVTPAGLQVVGERVFDPDEVYPSATKPSASTKN
jgi:phosphoribosyl-AMP cyclohydrolase